MKLRVIRTETADRDLSHIWSYIARDNPAAADRVIRAIELAIQTLSDEPELGVRMDHIEADLYCKPVRKRYLIFYTVQQDELLVLRLLHSARSYDRLF